MTPVQQLVDDLQRKLGLRIVSGTISLNLNDGKLQSVKTETYQRIPVDNPTDTRSVLTR